MADFSSVERDAVVLQILEKLSSVIEEGGMPARVVNKLEYIKHELATMSAYLEEAEDMEKERAKIKRKWITTVRELAYAVEDCIDEFKLRLVQLGDPDNAPRSDTSTQWLQHGTSLLRRGSRLITAVSTHQWLATEIEGIKARVEAACNEARRNGFTSTSTDTKVAPATIKYPSQLSDLFIQDVDGLVGIDKPREALLSLLLDGEKERTFVISVVGSAGVGKTTLVRRVIKSQRAIDGSFDCRAWITVSASFEQTGFLKKVSHELFNCGSDEATDEVQLIQKIRDYLHDKRYVLVFDDVWAEDVWAVDVWESIKLVLPFNKNGSRIIVTTRDEHLAHACCVPYHEHVYKLTALSTEQSRDLFCKRVFHDGPFPDEFKALSEQILQKCGGVPLAIVTIAGVLARKPTKTVGDWKAMVDHLGSGPENNQSFGGMMQVMTLSYNALPSHLKHCSLYLSIFPEDYEIDSKHLQSLWIAEGFVRNHLDLTPEEVAESYFNELICRSIIQPVRINGRGLVKSCVVNDVMLAFLISKSAEENLVTLQRSHRDATPQGVIRRLSLHHSSSRLLLCADNATSDHLRSLFVFGSAAHEPPPSSPPPHSDAVVSFICRSSFLRVLELNGVNWLTSSHIQEVGKLHHLRYLGLKGTHVDHIPESFGELQNLETLDAGGLNITLHAEVVKVRKLRHLRASRLEAPQGLGNWRALQTLDGLWLVGREGEVQELRNLKQLRKLRLMQLRHSQMKDFCDSVSEMSRCLQSLKVEFCASINTGKSFLDSLASPPLLLQRLELNGHLRKLPGWINSLEVVFKIILRDSRLKFDAIEALQKLPNLIALKLIFSAYVGEKLHFSGQGFRRLKTLTLEDLPLESLAFGVGSMPSLQLLTISKCDSLRKVGKFGRENLPCLNQVVVRGMPTSQRQQLREITEAHPSKPTFST